MTRRGGWIALVVLAAVCVVARLLVSRGIDGALSVGWNPDAASWRVGAVLSATAAGAALALAGLLLQGMLRNPLASPFVLGLSGGAQAAVAVATLAAWKAGGSLPVGAQAAVGALGAAAALGLCIVFGRARGGEIDPVGLVLAGVVVAAMAGSVASLCEWLLPPADRSALAAWGFGRVPEMPDRMLLGLVLTAVSATVLAGFAVWRHLDAMQLGDDEARSLGVPLAGARWTVVLVSSVLAAVATALCGPLAFVGLVGPHAARALVGGSHRNAVLGAALAGAALLCLADAARALVPVDGGRLPVGVICALAGGPAFLVLLRRGAAGVWKP